MRTDTKTWMNRKPYQSPQPIRLSEIEIAKDYTEYWTITPQKARELLDTMDNNRCVKARRVEQYAKEMASGLWKPEGSEIAISPTGRLLDGQHRLLAVIKVDQPMPFRVHLNVPEDTPFDIGVGRSSGDDLKMRGEIPPEMASTRVIATVNALLRNIYGKTEYRNMTNNDRADFINKNSEEIMEAIRISRIGDREPLCNKSGVHAALFAAIHCGVSIEILGDFVRKVNTGFGIDDSTSSASVLRTILQQSKERSRYKQGMPIDMQMSMAEQAIADFVCGKKRTKIYTKELHPYAMQIER